MELILVIFMGIVIGGFATALIKGANDDVLILNEVLGVIGSATGSVVSYFLLETVNIGENLLHAPSTYFFPSFMGAVLMLTAFYLLVRYISNDSAPQPEKGEDTLPSTRAYTPHAFLDKLDICLVEGKISETTYLEMKTKWEARLTHETSDSSNDTVQSENLERNS